VRRWVDGEGVDLVAIDSVIPAAGGADAMKPEAPTAYYQALRTLERPSLSLAHVPKDKAQAAHPFGSTYWSTPSRLVWRVERPSDDGEEHVIRLVNTKHSRWAWSTELLLKVGWSEPGPLRLRSALNLTLEKDAGPIIDRIVLSLRVAGRALAAEEIAERIGSTPDTVRTTIRRNAHRVTDDGRRPALFSLAEAPR
jgi:DNA-binding CsgD family transcriptional regulator